MEFFLFPSSSNNSALKIYKGKYGHLYVPSKWRVPRELEWPEKLWDLKLGYRVHNIRYRGDFVQENPKYRRLLDGLGFSWKGKRQMKRESERDNVGDVVVVDGKLYNFK